jgi:hypothetical protein
VRIAVLLIPVLIVACTTPGLNHFANNLQIVAQTVTQTMQVRVIKVQAFGECDGTDCPMETLYVAISELGEYPEQRLYKLAPARQWEFINWENRQDPATVSFRVKKTEDGKDVMYTLTIGLSRFKQKSTKLISGENNGRI